MPEQPAGNTSPQSRSVEFSSGATGMVGQGTTHTVQQSAPDHYSLTSVLSPLPQPNGVSSQTYNQNRALNYYRS